MTPQQLFRLEQTFQYLQLQLATIHDHETHEATAVLQMGLWLKSEPDEAVHEVACIIRREYVGFMRHPTVISMLELLEGMLALRKLLREMAQEGGDYLL